MKKVIGLIAALGLIAGIASAQVVMSKAADASVALRVKNGDMSTLTVVVTGAGTNFAVTVGGQAQTIDGNAGTGDIISEIAALFAACTNTSAKKTLTVDANCSLAADTTKAKMLDGTYTAAAGKWLELLWDTTAALHYDIYLPGGEYGSGSYKISKITGCPVGTGDVTLGIYQGGTLIGQQVYTSPKIALTLSPATNAADNVVNIDWAVDMRNLGGQAVIVRAARATSATTGIINAIIE